MGQVVVRSGTLLIIDMGLPMEQPTRVLTIQGVRNLRDLGAYATTDGRVTRWRTVLRSGALCDLDASAQRQIEALGLRSIVDVRFEEELQRSPNTFCTSTLPRYCWVPFRDTASGDGPVEEDLTLGYRRALDMRSAALIGVLRHLADANNLPALVHCAAGKDRTGVVVALLLAVLRVPPATIIADYALSRTVLGEEYLEASRQLVAARGEVWEDVAHLFDTPPERMQRTLDYLDDRWGGAEHYVLEHGLTTEELELLRELLTVVK